MKYEIIKDKKITADEMPLGIPFEAEYWPPDCSSSTTCWCIATCGGIFYYSPNSKDHHKMMYSFRWKVTNRRYEGYDGKDPQVGSTLQDATEGRFYEIEGSSYAYAIYGVHLVQIDKSGNLTQVEKTRNCPVTCSARVIKPTQYTLEITE